ncbi:MAG: mechanosensitive ion channel family protein [Planctomycetota bacterium]|jgi:small conductance mechanosensitive channel
MQLLHVNLITAGAEFLGVLIVVWILSALIARVIRGVGRLPAFQGKISSQADAIAKSVRFFLRLIGFLSALGLTGWNGWLLYKKVRIPDYHLDLIKSVPRSFWIGLGIGVGKVVAIIIVAAIVLKFVRKGLRAIMTWAQGYKGVTANNEAVERFFTTLERIATRATWLAVVGVACILLGLPDVVAKHVFVALRVYLIIAGGLLVWRGLDAIIASLDAVSKKYSKKQGLVEYYDRLKGLLPMLRTTAEYILYVAVASFALMQLELTAGLANLGTVAIWIIGVVFLARVVVEVANFLVEEVLLKRPKLTPEQTRIRQTMVPLFRSGVKTGVYFAALIVILGKLNINVAPILAGAGILGLAVGLGAQNVINDVVCGFLLLFENFYLVGDFVEIQGAEGIVESIQLRTTRVRDSRGRVHIVRNGQIDTVVNYSKDYTYAVVDVGVSYDSDLDHVFKVLTDVGKRAHKELSEVISPTTVRGVTTFGSSDIGIVTATKVKPGKHVGTERALRKMIKEAFDKEKIDIPYSHHVVLFPEGQPIPEAIGAGLGEPLAG